MTAVLLPHLAASDRTLGLGLVAIVALALVAIAIALLATLAVLVDRIVRRHASQRLTVLAQRDTLTGFHNRVAFDAELVTRVLNWRAEENFAVIAMEIVGIDRINRQYGPRMGDMVLRAVAQRLRDARAPGVFLARTGGAQFCGVGAIGSREELLGRAQRLRAALSGNVLIEAREIAIDLRVAAAIFPGDSPDADGLMRRALAALARAVADPLATVVLFDEAEDAIARRRLALAGDLGGALARNEFRLFYQPQVWAGDRSIIGYEALLRWQHPEFGMVSPAEFIPIAEQTGTIVAIGEWVLHAACAEAARWPDDLRVAVNVSPLQLRQSSLPDQVERALAASGLYPDRLEIELTESLLIEDRAKALQVFGRIKALGVRLALDDFGTGYSSMEVLRQFPFDKIKLDKSFLEDIATSRQARTILRAMLALGRALGIPVLAEGVETEEQLEILRREGCRKVQGFLIGRPAPSIAAPATGLPLASAA